MRRVLALLALLGLPAMPAVARADRKEDAAAAYDRGAAAYDRGDYVVAGRELACADELAPNAVTLELALGAAVKSDDAVLGMMLVERAERRKGIRELVVNGARKKLAPKVGRIDVTCPDRGCEVALDGGRIEPGVPRLVLVGAHRVVITRGRAPERFDVTIEAGKTVQLVPGARVEPAAPPAVAAPVADTPRPTLPPRPVEGPSPAWFWGGVGVTAVVGGATTISALDTASKHDGFLRDRSDVAAASAGQDAEQRTVVLLVGTGVVAVVTATLGLFFVHWGQSKKKTAGLVF